jgi:cytochrome c556
MGRCPAKRSTGEISMKVRFKLVVLAGMLWALAGSASAQQSKTDQGIKHRKAAFTLMISYVNRLVQTVEGHRPYDAKQVAQDAKTVELLSQLPWEGFVEGSERGETRAKDDIWLEEEKFKRYAAELQAKAASLSVVAQSGDAQRLKAAVGQLRETCNACHKAFRKD